MDVGTTFGRYRLDELIGEGGFGQVFGAFDVTLQRRVALKVLRPGAISDEGRARMLREARVAAGIEHPNIVRVYDVGEHDGIPFIAMERLRGASLRDRIGDPSLSLPTKLRWLVDIACALSAAHGLGLVHRDIKPDNIHIGKDGVVRVLDFGIARAATGRSDSQNVPTITGKGILVGTPGYMAPEHLRDDRVDTESDQFSWGVVAYELLSGKSPWKGEGVQLVANILSAEPASLEDFGIPENVAAVVKRALEKEAKNRFESLDAVIAELSPLAEPARPSTPAASSSSAQLTLKNVAFQRTEPVTTPAGPFSQPTKKEPRTTDAPLSDNSKSDLAASVEVKKNATLASARLPRTSHRALRPLLAGAAVVALLAGYFAWRHAQSSAVSAPLTDAPKDSGRPTQRWATDPTPHAPAWATQEELAAYRDAWTDYRNGAEDAAKQKFAAIADKNPRFAAAALRAAWSDAIHGADTNHHFFNVALAARAELDPHDRAFMDAIQAGLLREPPDFERATQELDRAVGEFKDFELELDLAELFFAGGEIAPSETHARAALLDAPDFAPVYYSLAEADLYVGKWDDEAKLLDKCEEQFPLSTLCLVERMFLDENIGECGALENVSARLATIGGSSDIGAARTRIRSLIESGATADTVAQAYALAKGKVPGLGTDAFDAHIRCAVAGRDGDFTTASKACADWQRAVATVDSKSAVGEAARAAYFVATEVGQSEIALGIARDFLNRRKGFSPGTRHDDGAAIDDPTIDFALALRESGAMSPHAFEDLRTDFLRGYNFKSDYRTMSWLMGWAAGATTKASAEEALAKLPEFGPLTKAAAAVHPYAYAAHAYLLAGDADGAIAHGRHAAHSCDVFHDPFVVIRAGLDLGQAYELKGQTKEACDAYDLVIGHWGHAKPRSITAEKARARKKALACAEPR